MSLINQVLTTVVGKWEKRKLLKKREKEKILALSELKKLPRFPGTIIDFNRSTGLEHEALGEILLLVDGYWVMEDAELAKSLMDRGCIALVTYEKVKMGMYSSPATPFSLGGNISRREREYTYGIPVSKCNL